MPDEIKLEPHYAALRARFAAEAKLQADGDLDELLPLVLMEPFDRQIVQLAVFRAMKSVLVPINICLQAIDCNAAVNEVRELVDEVTKSVIAKTEEIEEAIHAEDYRDDDEEQQ